MGPSSKWQRSLKILIIEWKAEVLQYLAHLLISQPDQEALVNYMQISISCIVVYDNWSDPLFALKRCGCIECLSNIPVI